MSATGSLLGAMFATCLLGAAIALTWHWHENWGKARPLHRWHLPVVNAVLTWLLVWWLIYAPLALTFPAFKDAAATAHWVVFQIPFGLLASTAIFGLSLECFRDARAHRLGKRFLQQTLCLAGMAFAAAWVIHAFFPAVFA